MSSMLFREVSSLLSLNIFNTFIDFNSVRENLQSVYHREKDHYDLGAIERFHAWRPRAR